MKLSTRNFKINLTVADRTFIIKMKHQQLDVIDAKQFISIISDLCYLIDIKSPRIAYCASGYAGHSSQFKEQ